MNMRIGNSFFKEVFSGTESLIACLDKDLRFVKVNDAYAKAGGSEPDFFVGKRHFDLYPDEENEQIFQGVLKSGNRFSIREKPFKYPDRDDITYWDWTLAPVIRDGKVEGLILSLVDRTADVTSRQALEMANRRLEITSLINQLIAKALDEKDFIRGVQEALGRGGFILSISEGGEMKPGLRRQLPGSRWLQIYPEDDRPFIDSVAEDIAFGISVHRLKDENKRITQELRIREERYRELVENTNSIILRMDAKGKIRFLNRYGREFFGYELEEIVGHDVAGTILPLTDSSGRDMLSMVQSVIDDPESYQMHENENITRDRRRVWINWTNKPMYGPDGKVREILSIGHDVTMIRRQEEEIRKLNSELEQRVRQRTMQLQGSEMKYRSLFENSPIGIFQAKPDGTIITANKAFVRMLGYSDIHSMMSGPGLQDYLGKDADVLQLLEQQGMIRDREQEARKKDGSMIRVSLNLSKIKHPGLGLIYEGIIGDITERKEAEEELKSVARFVEENPNAVLRLDKNMELVYSNPQARELLRDGKVPCSWASEAKIALDTGEKRVVELQGVKRSIMLTIVPIAGKYVNIYGADITDRKKAEDELKRAYERLQMIDLMKSSILRDVSHELKHPISLIRMAIGTVSEELKKPQLDYDKLQRYMLMLQRNSRMFEEQLTSVLELSRLQATNMISRDDVDIRQLIDEIVEENIDRAQAKGIEIVLEIEPIPQLYINREMIRRLIRNLVDNAIKYTILGRISIIARRSKEGIEISVEDTGVGLGPEDISLVFDPYYKADVSSDGLGVGLAIAKKIVDLHSGSIEVASEVGKGSRFTVFLPAG